MSVLPRVTPPGLSTQLKVPPRLGTSSRIEGAPQRAKPLMRKYEVLYLEQNGDIGEFRRIAPATAAFESAFSAFARGALVATSRGPVAVEDLFPGDEVKTVEDGYQTLLWRGAMTLVPGAAGQRREMGRLSRFSADSLGIARPMPDLILGPSARLYNRTRAAQALARGDGAFVPGRDYLDGINVIELTPPSPVQVYHLAFRDHQRLVANGVEIESHHPGTLHELGARGDILKLYLTFFPHVREFLDFGPMRHPRLRMSDLDLWAQAANQA